MWEGKEGGKGYLAVMLTCVDLNCTCNSAVKDFV